MQNKESGISPEELISINKKFNELHSSISNMEVFYQNTLKEFQIWRRYVKSNEFKSHVYTVKSISDIGNEDNSINKMNEENEKEKEKPKHFMSSDSYWNIRIILTQAFVMSMCSTYIYPTLFFIFYSPLFLHDKKREENNLFCFLCGVSLSMTPVGGLFSMALLTVFERKSYKIPMLISSILSIIGNLLFSLALGSGNLILLFIGRLIVGFSLNTPIHRQYFLYFIPKRKISKYLLYFKLIVLSGNSAGPLLSLICLFNYSKKDIKDGDYLNPYTYPGWICTIVSSILLILVFLLFTEPISKKFTVYALGQEPSETVSRSDSFSLDDSLTNYESEKLDEINKKVSFFNDENQYDDTNLVSSTVNNLIDREIEPHGTVRKAFWIIIFYEFILNYTIMSYITMTPCYLYLNPDSDPNESEEFESPVLVSILYFISLALFVPTYFVNLFYVSHKIDKISYIKVLAIFLFILELMTTLLVSYGKYPDAYYFSFLFSILFAYVLEDQLVYFYIKMIPSDFELLGIKGLTGLHIIAYIGDICGAGSSLFGLFSKNKKDKGQRKLISGLMMWQNIFGIIFQVLVLVAFFIYSNRFIDKSIRRLVYSKNVRKIRRTEF